MKKYYWILLCVFIYGCASPKPFFEKIDSSNNELLKTVLDAPEKYKLQIIYSEIIREKDGGVKFIDHTYHLNDSVYFYPASTVKLPVAILALEKLKDLNEKKGLSLSRETKYKVQGDTLYHSIKNDIEAIFAVSDNDAFNRLFEFLGPDEINSELRSKGLSPVRISHRLSTEDAFNLNTKPLIFYPDASQENMGITMPVSHNAEIKNLELKEITKGVGYYQNDTLVNSPFDFSLKNYFPLSVQHQLMKQLFFPGNFRETSRFDLDSEDRKFLFQAMSQMPREAGYNPQEYYDSYVKFFIYGDSKESIPENIKIYNKVGDAYGTLTETAYIKDESKNIEFILSATISVNENQIFNDNVYEYETIGIPFLAALGRAVYAHEVKKRSK